MTKTTEAIEYCKYVLSQVAAKPAWKVFGSVVFSFLSKYFHGIDSKAMAIVYMLMMADFITGVIASRHSGESVRSSKILRTVEKMFLYGILMVTGFLIDSIMHLHIAHASSIIFVGATEFWSILENINRSGFPIPTNLLKDVQNIAKKK